MALLIFTFQSYFYEDSEIEGLFEAELLQRRGDKRFGDRWFGSLIQFQLWVCLTPIIIWIVTHISYKVNLYDHQRTYEIDTAIGLNKQE